MDAGYDATSCAMFPSSGFDGSQRLNRFSGAFPDPYLDYASTQMPRSIYDVLRWAEYLFLIYGTYKLSMQRVVRYFLTDIELVDCSDDEQEKYEKFLKYDLRIMEALADIGDDFMAYGNSFFTIRIPFRRYLQCPKCHLERPIGKVHYKWIDWKFDSECPNEKCGYKGAFKRVDRRSIEQDKLKIIRFSPHEIRLLYHPVFDKTIYLWDMPGWFTGEVRKGNTFYLETTPWEIIETCRDKNKLFRFDDDVIYHMKESTLAGVRHFGWGIPRVMSNFKQAWYIQVLKRYNEAIALDYIIPFRVVTPEPGTSREADPLLHMNLSNFQHKVLSAFRMHRRDPTSIHCLPFPVKMDLLGAEGHALTPTDLMDKATDELLNAQGVPAELYRGTLQWQAMPGAVRLFERTWTHFVGELNHALSWIVKKSSELRNWETIKVRLQPPTMADDLDKKFTQLQLAASGKISDQTSLLPFGLNVRDEFKKLLKEEQFRQEEMAKYQEEAAQKNELQQTMAMGASGQLPGQMAQGQPQGQQAPQGGQEQAQQGAQGQVQQMMPSQMAMQAGGMGSTPEDMMQSAEQIAYQLLSMPFEMRTSEMRKIKKGNETLHALVVSKMKTIKQQAQSQGGFQMLQATLGNSGGR